MFIFDEKTMPLEPSSPSVCPKVLALASNLPASLQASTKHLNLNEDYNSANNKHKINKSSTTFSSISTNDDVSSSSNIRATGSNSSAEELHNQIKKLPIVDLKFWDRSEKDREEISSTLREVCQESGFFYLANHGVSPELMDNALAASEEFFALPLEQKKEIEWHKCFIGEIHPASARGYFTLRGEALDPDAEGDDKEFLDMGENVDLSSISIKDPREKPFHGPMKWPKIVLEEKKHIKDTLEEYIEESKKAARKLLQVIAFSLSFNIDFFESLTDDPMIIHRIIHYPAIEKFEESGLRISAGKHTDYGLITLLYQVEYGLQIRQNISTQGEKQWVWVPPPPQRHLFTVNIGDGIQILTNQRYVSTMHRVVNVSGRERYSVAFFFDANFDAVLKPILQTPAEKRMGEKEQSPKFEQLAAGQVKLAKYQAVWSTEKELVQIDHEVDCKTVEDVLFRQ